MSDAPNQSRKIKRKPFKLTKELLRLARNDGWTQAEIAQACRTQQSVVSGWLKGTGYGTEEQLKKLLDQYGSKLRRKTFRVYWNFHPETHEKQFFRVEGNVIFSLVFFDLQRDTNGKIIKKTPSIKLVIHHQGHVNFRVIQQYRVKFSSDNQLLEHSIENAMWCSEILEQVNTNELIEFIDDFSRSTLLKTYPHDSETLPFLIRQALLNHGFNVEGIVDYPSLW